MKTQKPSKILAYLAVIVGFLLLLGGCTATIGYLGLPITTYGEDILGEQLGQMAGIFLGLVCGGLAVIHGIASIRNRRSRSLKLAPFYVYWIVFALVLGLGNLLLNIHVSEEFLFPFLFLLGAALPTLAMLAWAYRRLGWPLTWRQGALMLVAGSTFSIAIAIILEGILPILAYLLVEPLAYLAEDFLDTFYFGGPELLERLFYSPMLVFFFIFIALQAPIPEEFAKTLGPALMGKRIQNERQAFAIGLAAGAGFAILENMLYQGLYAQMSGWGWGGITLLRGIGAVNHSLWTAIIALALFRARKREKGWFGRLAGAYLLSVGLHTLWNGGFEAFVYLTGLDYFGGLGPSLSIYGEYIEILLVAYLVFLSAGLWWLLRRYVTSLGEEAQPDLAPSLVSRRALAGWALACALFIIPIGAALGPAWNAIRSVVIEGQVKAIQLPEVGNPTDANLAAGLGAVSLKDLASEEYDWNEQISPGIIFEYHVALDTSQAVLWEWLWCATSKEILDGNFENIQLEFYLNQTLVTLDHFATDDYVMAHDSNCRAYHAVVEQWPPGRYNMETRATFLQPIDNGWITYQAGTYTDQYIVTVKR